MIDKKIYTCTECLKCKKCKARRFPTLKNLNIHLRMKHKTNYIFKVENGTLRISRVKRA